MQFYVGLSENDVFACAYRRLRWVKNMCFRMTDDEHGRAKMNAYHEGLESIPLYAKRKVLEVDIMPSSITVSNASAKPVLPTCILMK